MKFEFPSISKQQWLAKIEADLKGIPLDQLTWEYTDQLHFSPFSCANDLESSPQNLATRGSNAWYISETIRVTDVLKANQNALAALEAGATGLKFIIENSCDYHDLLKNINLNWIFLSLIAHPQDIAQFKEYLRTSSFNKQDVDIAIDSPSDNFDEYVNLKTIKIDHVHNLKADDQIVSLLLEATKKILNGILIDKLWFAVHMSDSFYLNICKIRAFKLLWQMISQGFNTKSHVPFIQANISAFKTNSDSDYNKIRHTNQVLSAAIGGVSLIDISLPLNDPDRHFHRRIARNVQHLLQLESFINRVEDPAAGSYYLETMTDALAESAWQKFQHKYKVL